MKNITRWIFYGNFFLGFYAVALCIETNLLNHLSLNRFPFYLFIFFSTTVYYTMIYIRSVGAINYDERTIWYRNNLTVIKKILKVSIAIIFILANIIIVKNLGALFLLSPLEIITIISFPLIAAWYTFSPKIFRLKKIRQIGWIKPFIVGLIWAGWVTVYPVLLLHLNKQETNFGSLFPLQLLFVQNFLFFSENAIIFDAKDYSTDSYHRLRTLPVIFGIRNTFRFVLAPLILLNLFVFFVFQYQQHFTAYQTTLQLLPYLLLILLTINYRQQRSVLYYLVAVDGLVFVKAICGITSILFLNK